MHCTDSILIQVVVLFLLCIRPFTSDESSVFYSVLVKAEDDALKSIFPKVGASPVLPLTNDKLKLITLSAQLSFASYHQKVYGNYDVLNDVEFTYLETKDSVDAVVTLDFESYCFVAFRGSRSPLAILTPGNIEDWLTENINIVPVEISKRQIPRQNETTAKTTTVATSANASSNIQADVEVCSVTKGFYKSYSGIGIDRLNQFIDKCMVGHGLTSKQLVLTGHSQGGAAACVASIINADYYPLVITFGQPPFFGRDHKKKCNLLNYHHIWRFINTENSQHGLHYDPIPFIKLFEPGSQVNAVGPHIGSSIHLAPNSKGNTNPDPYSTAVFYRPTSQATSYMERSDLEISTDFSAHSLKTYVTKVQFLKDNGSDPLHVGGYITGTQCQVNFECQSFGEDGGGCSDNVCIDPTNVQRGAVGDPCDDNSDCKTGRCDYKWTGLSKQCYDKKSKGSNCNEDTDCNSGRCTWFWICQ